MKIKPSIISHERFFSHTVSHLIESVKEKTTDYVDKVKVKQQDINSFAITSTKQKGNNSLIEKQHPQFVIPVIEERHTLSKKQVLDDVKIEKRWISHNDKELDSYSTENIFTQLKGKFLDFVYIEGNDDEENKIENEKRDVINYQEEHQKQFEIEKVKQQTQDKEPPLFDEGTKGKQSIQKDYDNEMLKDESQKIIPLYAEKIIISKRKVKVGEIVISKRKVIENKKINFEIIKEKIIVNYADGRKENIIE